MANPQKEKSLLADSRDNPMITEQVSTVTDAAAATAAPAALTGAANAAVTGAVVGDTVSTTAGWGSSTEAGFDSMHVAIDANVVDIALILAQADKSTVDIAAQKVELDQLITDVGLMRTAVNAVNAALETHGLTADA